MRRIAALLLLAATTVKAWTGCVDPENQDALVKIGEQTIICLQIGNTVNWAEGVEYIRLAFQPTADEYSRFHVPNSFSNLVSSTSGTIWETNNVTVGVASQQSLSFLRVFYDPTVGLMFPYFTAIIDVQDGIVRGITWDDACIFCGGGSACKENTFNFNGVAQTQETSGQPTKSCAIPVDECRQAVSSTACDITLYVVWTGTDAEGRALLSSANRFSAFPAQNIRDRITRNLPQFPDLPDLPNVNLNIPGTGNNDEDEGSNSTRNRDL